MMRHSVSAASFISCCCLLLTTSLVDGQAVISVLEPLNIVAHRPGQFSLTVHKTGVAKSPATIIVEVCYLQLITVLLFRMYNDTHIGGLRVQTTLNVRILQPKIWLSVSGVARNLSWGHSCGSVARRAEIQSRRGGFGEKGSESPPASFLQYLHTN